MEICRFFTLLLQLGINSCDQLTDIRGTVNITAKGSCEV